MGETKDIPLPVIRSNDNIQTDQQKPKTVIDNVYTPVNYFSNFLVRKLYQNQLLYDYQLESHDIYG